MAHIKAGGTAKNLKDSPGQRLGVKIYGGQVATPGSIIIRQRGTKFRAGENVLMGKDHTLFAKVQGTVKFTEKKIKKFTGKLEKTNFVNVINQ